MNNLVEKKKYLKLYLEGAETGRVPRNGYGLCDLFKKDRLFDLFKPHNSGEWYWANDGETSDYTVLFATQFTDLRATIILFMAAMNNEL